MLADAWAMWDLGPLPSGDIPRPPPRPSPSSVQPSVKSWGLWIWLWTGWEAVGGMGGGPQSLQAEGRWLSTGSCDVQSESQALVCPLTPGFTGDPTISLPQAAASRPRAPRGDPQHRRETGHQPDVGQALRRQQPSAPLHPGDVGEQ